MRRPDVRSMVFLLALSGLWFGCSPQPSSTAPAPDPDPAPPPAPAQAPALPDPSPEEGKRIQDVVRRWIAANVGADRMFDIPPRGGHDLQGVVYGFHPVHREDEDTFSLCVEFKNGPEIYDVDFLVDRKDDGMAVTEHRLHKVNGQAVP